MSLARDSERIYIFLNISVYLFIHTVKHSQYLFSTDNKKWIFCWVVHHLVEPNDIQHTKKMINGYVLLKVHCILKFIYVRNVNFSEIVLNLFLHGYYKCNI